MVLLLLLLEVWQPLSWWSNKSSTWEMASKVSMLKMFTAAETRWYACQHCKGKLQNLCIFLGTLSQCLYASNWWQIYITMWANICTECSSMVQISNYKQNNSWIRYHRRHKVCRCPIHYKGIHNFFLWIDSIIYQNTKQTYGNVKKNVIRLPWNVP